MPECIEKKKLLKAIEESEPDVMADYGEYYGSEWGISRGKLYEIIANLPTLTPPNEPLTQEDIDKMHFDRVWIDYGLDDSGERCGEDGVILYGKLYSIDTLDGSAFEDLLLNACDGETLGRPSGDYTVYRRPPEGGDADHA